MVSDGYLSFIVLWYWRMTCILCKSFPPGCMFDVLGLGPCSLMVKFSLNIMGNTSTLYAPAGGIL